MPKLEISRVHDAYAAGGECPLCSLRDHAERTYTQSFRGNRVMEPSVRQKTNETGFCPEHYRGLYAGEGKLGLALVVHTHLQEKLPEIRAALEAAVNGAAAGHGAGARRGRKGGSEGAQRLDAIAAQLSSLRDRCFICDMLEADLERYAFTILYLWQKDPEFPPVLRASRGFCLSHFLLMLGRAREILRGESLARWLGEVVPLMSGSLEKLEKDLFAFTQLHQGTNRSLGTEEERSALARTLQKLSGRLMSHD
ncbi:MAG: hypothetical protein IMZ55_06890 [Acidobacteria bacterium]|nr:hypothetical protein [Acidobacteriota bacterium]